MRILVTGSEGNIGSKLIPYLRLKGHTVYRCDQVQSVGNDYSVVNINSPADLSVTFMKFLPDIVCHLAAMVSRVTCENSPALTVETNLVGLYNIIQFCREYGSRLIYFSTSEIYGDIGGILSESRQDIKPNNIYGLTKYLGEKLVEYELTKGLKALILRPFMFYDEDETLGEHRSAMIRFAENLIRGKSITVHRESERSWTHISDAIRIIEKLLYVRDFQIVNIGSNNIIKTSLLAEKMCKYLHINYSDYVNLTDIPERMTLTKIPNLDLQYRLTNYACKINIDEGIRLVIDKVKTRVI